MKASKAILLSTISLISGLSGGLFVVTSLFNPRKDEILTGVVLLVVYVTCGLAVPKKQ
jgi:uncharacterized protein YneF (UPF0154 family)